MGRFDDLISDQCPRGVEYEDLQTIFITRNGYTPSKSVEANWTSGTIPWFRMEDIRDHGRVLGDSIQKVASSALKGGSLFPANSVIVATSATIGEHALITVPHLSNQRFTSLSLKPQYAEKV
ncbi:MAG: restriction endonuclease subunit S [Marmoricola sp.]